MIWFSEILPKKPSTYINWPYFVGGRGFQIETTVFLFFHSVNMTSVNCGLIPRRMFLYNLHQETNTVGSDELHKNACRITCSSQAKEESKMNLFTPICK